MNQEKHPVVGAHVVPVTEPNGSSYNVPTVTQGIVEQTPVNLASLKKNVESIQHAMKDVMKEGEHYGLIEGCGDKQCLFKSGAEKIALMFRLIPTFEVTKVELSDGHREYSVLCFLNAPSGNLMGQGVGLCSTMESKYRYRGKQVQVLDEPIPDDYKQNKAAYAKKGFVCRKVDGAWAWCKTTDERQENLDIADTFNTVLKMAKKRAFVDAVITTTGVSDIFTQDIDENQTGQVSQKQGEVNAEVDMLQRLVVLYQQKILGEVFEYMPDAEWNIERKRKVHDLMIRNGFVFFEGTNCYMGTIEIGELEDYMVAAPSSYTPAKRSTSPESQGPVEAEVVPADML
jgi:hypothetical protein